MRFTGKITKCNFTPECGSIRASNPELDYGGRVLIDFKIESYFRNPGFASWIILICYALELAY